MFHLRHSEDGVDSLIFIISLSFSLFTLLVYTVLQNLHSRNESKYLINLINKILIMIILLIINFNMIY